MRTRQRIRQQELFIGMMEAADRMQGLTFDELSFTDESFEGMKTHAEIVSPWFSNCRFTDSEVGSCIKLGKFVGCTFTGCTFRDVVWTDFENCTFIRCSFERIVEECDFKESTLSEVTFKLELQKTTFAHCQIQESGLYYPEDCTFEAVTLTDVEFIRATYCMFKRSDFVSCAIEEEAEDSRFDSCQLFDMAIPDCTTCVWRNITTTDCLWQTTTFVKTRGVSRIDHNGSAYLVFHGDQLHVLSSGDAPRHIDAVITLLGA